MVGGRAAGTADAVGGLLVHGEARGAGGRRADTTGSRLPTATVCSRRQTRVGCLGGDADPRVEGRPGSERGKPALTPPRPRAHRAPEIETTAVSLESREAK